MPKYCYRCNVCANQFEVIHSMSESVSLCPECHCVDNLTRIPQIQNIKRDTSVGRLVEEAIEENRKILKDEQQKRSEEANDDT